jgi:hypothetical protein
VGNSFGALFLAVLAIYPANVGVETIGARTYTSTWSGGSGSRYGSGGRANVDTKVTHVYTGRRAILIGIGWLSLAALLGVASLGTGLGGLADWTPGKAVLTWISLGLAVIVAVSFYPPWAILSEARSAGFYGTLSGGAIAALIAFRIREEKPRGGFINACVFAWGAGLLFLGMSEKTDLAVGSLFGFVALLAALGHAMLLVAKWRAGYLEFQAKIKATRGP